MKINVKLIYDYIKSNKISKSEFCRRAKIGIKVLNKILNNNFNFEVDNIFKVAKLLKLQVYELFI